MHFLVDLFGCENFPDQHELTQWIRSAVDEAGMHFFFSDAADFPQAEWKDDYGASCLALIVPLRESHVTVHTWPEKRVACLDLFTCGSERRATLAVFHLAERFNARDRKVHRVQRGQQAIPFTAEGSPLA